MMTKVIAAAMMAKGAFWLRMLAMLRQVRKASLASVSTITIKTSAMAMA